jgi:transcription initiation factor TFIIB
MISFYESSISKDDEYPHLLSDSTDFMCTNCGTTKEKKGKRRYGKPQSNQTRTITDHESGEVICSTCGMVISDKNQSSDETIIGNSAESNTFRQRTGSNFSLARHDKGLYTVIGERDSDAYGRQLDPLVRHSIHKIRMYDTRTQSGFRDRNRKKAFTELDKLRNKMGLSDNIVEKTA